MALWYPIKNNDAVELFYKKMKRTEIRRQLVLELNIFPPDLPMGLNGTGMLVINPPWQFDALNRFLQYPQPILQHPESPQMSVEQRTEVQWLNFSE
ncbi:MAG: 23S rRNA (adenine(2030)-N(6))-methyltransferase RlmJ [Moraxella osloensis]